MSSIATNNNASKAVMALTGANQSLLESTQRLSTGRRINSASDDQAGLRISSKLSTSIVSLERAVKNANDGMSMLQTADQGAGKVSEALFRMRELAIQAANDTYSEADRISLNKEFTELQEQANAHIQSTQWNGQALFNGELDTVNLQIGASANDSYSVDMANFTDLSSLSNSAITTRTDALSALDAIEADLASVDEVRVRWGAAVNRLEHAGEFSDATTANLSASRSRIVDTDYAQTTADLAKAQILQFAGQAMLSQANQEPLSVLRLLR